MVQRLKKLLTPSALKIGMLITFITIVVYAMDLPFFETMELRAYDLHFLTRGTIPPGNDVAIVSIDQKSIDALGRWPWPRYRIADLIDRLRFYGAKVVAFDVVFSEPDESSGIGVIRRIKDQFSGRDVRLAFETATREADNDAKLASALKKNPNVILGYFFFTSADDLNHVQSQSTKFAEYPIPSRFTSVRYLDEQIHQLRLPVALGVERNIPALAGSAEDFGYFNILPDRDGTVRWVPLAIQYNNEVFSHLSLEAVRKYLGSPPLILNAAEYGVDSILLGDRVVPTDERGRLLINYRGGEKTFPYYSASDVIAGAVPQTALKDKIVLIGATAIGIYDMRVVPYSGTFPGVEIHANIIDNILKGDSISRPDWIMLFDLAMIVLIGVLLSWIMPRVGPLFATIVTIVLVAGYVLINQFIFVHWKVWLTEVYPVFTIISVASGVTTYRFMTEEKNKRQIREAFSRYVSPTLVTAILKDPNKLVLGGEERRLTVFFADIRGFTTISEGLSPQALVKLINDYLSPMTDIILRNGGTVDKYMGDAIMAFWGAPVWQEDHAVRAAKTSLDMMDQLRVLQAQWAREGLPTIDIGIGLSTGRLTVGNMGSGLRFDYTVMGDSVNLGSRLEGLNKEYGTHIIVPKYTYEDIKNEFVLRELDRIRVKGKKVPIHIFELMGMKGDQRLSEIAAAFEAGLAAYRRKKWDVAIARFQETLAKNPGDGPSRTFLTRIENLKQLDLPADWDGVYTMTRK